MTLYFGLEQLGAGNIAALSSFVAPAQKDDKLVSASNKVEAIARTIVDPHFRYATTRTLDVSKISVRGSQEPVVDLRRRPAISQRDKPTVKLAGFR